MTPNEKKFWNILSEPYEQSCNNCKWYKDCFVRPITPIAESRKHNCRYLSLDYCVTMYDNWEWDGKNHDE